MKSSHSRFFPGSAIVITLSVFMGSCTAPEYLHSSPGPEDLTLGKLHGKTNLYTATSTRTFFPATRNPATLEVLTPGVDQAFRIIWQNTPDPRLAETDFNLVGIHAVNTPDSTHLYVACSNNKTKPHTGRVMHFRVSQTGQATPLAASPFTTLLAEINGITVAPNGQIYVSTFDLSSTFTPTQPAIGPNPTPNAKHTNSIYLLSPDLKSVTQVAHNVRGANGLAITQDGKYLLACAYYDRKVYACRRDPRTGSFQGEWKPATEKLPFYPDNLKAIGSDRFSITGQNSIIMGIPHFLFGWHTLTGQTGWFEWTPQSPQATFQPFASIGNDHRGPSVSLPVGKQLYIGHILSPGVARVPLTPAQP